MLKQVVFTSQNLAEQSDGQADWVVISITQPSEPEAQLKTGWRSVLRLKFHDVDDEGSILAVFSVEQARAVLAFIAEHSSHVKGVLVHCHAGVSRSAAIAKFIGERYGVEEFMNQYAGYTRHNRLVYSKLVEASRARTVARGTDSVA